MKQQEHDDNDEIVIQRPVIENELRFTYDQIRYVCCDSDASYSFDDCIVQLDWIPKLVIFPETDKIRAEIFAIQHIDFIAYITWNLEKRNVTL